jgi:hypothetical protein
LTDDGVRPRREEFIVHPAVVTETIQNALASVQA